MRALSDCINDILDRHEEVYKEMVARLGPQELQNVFTEMNVNNFGRAMAYLTLVYLMNIPEDAKCEAVRLAAVILKDIDTSGVERRLLRRIGRMLSNMFAM